MTASLSADAPSASSVSPLSPGDLPLSPSIARVRRNENTASPRGRASRPPSSARGRPHPRKRSWQRPSPPTFRERVEVRDVRRGRSSASSARSACGAAHLRDWMRSQPRDVGLAFLPASGRWCFSRSASATSCRELLLQLALAPLVGAIAAGNHVMVKPELARPLQTCFSALARLTRPSSRPTSPPSCVATPTSPRRSPASRSTTSSSPAPRGWW